MDAAGRAKPIFRGYHRQYGHHLIYDLPINDPKKIPYFLEHLLSVVFTKQGLPILPSNLIENPILYKYFKNPKYADWFFLNAFDVLNGTILFYYSSTKFLNAWNNNNSIESFEDFAKSFGIGAIELAIAISSSNPLLFLGASLEIASNIIELLNDESRISFNKHNQYLELVFNNINLEMNINDLDIKLDINDLDLKLDDLEIKNN